MVHHKRIPQNLSNAASKTTEVEKALIQKIGFRKIGPVVVFTCILYYFSVL